MRTGLGVRNGSVHGHIKHPLLCTGINADRIEMGRRHEHTEWQPSENSQQPQRRWFEQKPPHRHRDGHVENCPSYDGIKDGKATYPYRDRTVLFDACLIQRLNTTIPSRMIKNSHRYSWANSKRE